MHTLFVNLFAKADGSDDIGVPFNHLWQQSYSDIPYLLTDLPTYVPPTLPTYVSNAFDLYT